MKTNLKTVALIFLFVSILFSKDYYPRSKEASFVETTEPGIVMIKASGIGVDNDNKKPKASVLDKSANLDAARAAVWFVLFGGSDPLITNDQSKMLFDQYQQDFFGSKNITKYIAWQADYYDNRVSQGKKLKITKSFKINRRILTEDLVSRNIIKSMEEVAVKMGRPNIMVLPEKKQDVSQLDLLKTDQNLKKAAEVIESYLSADGYEVVIPEMQETIQQMTSAQFAVSGHEDDMSYLLALSVGSDVYITYTVDVSEQRVGSTIVKKAAVGCRAYETTTARLLGSETGYSPSRNTADAVLIEEAMKDAIDKVILRVLSYWEKDMVNGIQYKLIVKVSSDFDQDEAEDILFDVSDVLDEIAKSKKENIFADYTLDLNIWCAGDDYPGSTDIYRAMRKKYEGQGSLKREVITRKLILLQVVNE
ncbi:MAG: hypothetical protein JXQ65_06380 [Candidatus Marinimicrobia bacterium]|nr:hypothetical protein [Candidatus Neomarinimicrobiota bacterium]